LVTQGKYQFKPEFPFSPGNEVAGFISRLGPGVDPALKGARVIALTRSFGGYATEVKADASSVFLLPESVPLEEGGALLMTYGTTLYALRERGGLKKGETLLVLGAAGGVGTAAVELGKAMGARVIAAASTQDKVDACIRLGADAGIVYGGKTPQDVKKEIRALTKDNGIDVV